MENAEIKDVSMMVKIKALIDKANSTDSQEEKDAFMMKAQELIQKHGLEVSKIMAVKGGRNSTGFTEEDIIEEHIKYDENWDRELMRNVAVGNMCKIIYESSANLIYVIGCESNVQSVHLLIDFYRKAIYNLAIEDAKNKKRRALMVAKSDKDRIKANSEEKSNIIDYLFGAVNGLKDALEKKEAIFEVEEFPSGNFNNGMQLMITGKSIITANKDRIDEYISRTYPSLGYFRGGSGGGNPNSMGYAKGYSDGGGLGAGQRRLN